MNSSNKVLLIFVLALLAGRSNATPQEHVPASDPKQAAIESSEKGDYRYLSAPSCFNGLPGYSGNAMPKPWPPKKAIIDCEELIGKELLQKMNELNEYAETYNKKMIELRKLRNIEN